MEICNVYIGKMIIKAAKRIFNSNKICRSYSDLNFGVTFFGTQCSRLQHFKIPSHRTYSMGKTVRQTCMEGYSPLHIRPLQAMSAQSSTLFLASGNRKLLQTKLHTKFNMPHVIDVVNTSSE